ncbi:hypothetical protein M5K25_000625 [Dendrobium thyrsiflorum]|uniref:Uncharacterized protein n=1 Tax=Dendrobium thyrsiflorum TaxID=117978 RepID=A0ABD0VUS4_DENTH
MPENETSSVAHDFASASSRNPPSKDSAPKDQAEFTVKGSSSTMPSKATYASPSEVRRIFTMGLPYTEHHGWQILFGTEVGYLYIMMGDDGNDGDPFNCAQTKESLLGKIMRLYVNNIPSSSEINDLRGNYSTPKDNHSANDSQLIVDDFHGDAPWIVLQDDSL